MSFNSMHGCQNSELNKNILKMVISKVLEVSKLKGGAYYCYCAYILCILRYSGFPISDAFKCSEFFCGLKLSVGSRSFKVPLVSKKKIRGNHAFLRDN